MPAVCSQKISAVSGETLSLLAGSGPVSLERSVASLRVHVQSNEDVFVEVVQSLAVRRKRVELGPVICAHLQI